MLGVKQTPEEDDNVIEISDSDEIIVDESSGDDLFDQKQLSDLSSNSDYQPIKKVIVKQLQPWQINPKSEVLNNGKVLFNQN